MNAKQRATWGDLVRQCESRSYSSINVASKIRSDAIVAAGELVELVTLELAALLERLSEIMPAWGDGAIHRADLDEASELAARIREALAQEVSDAKSS